MPAADETAQNSYDYNEPDLRHVGIGEAQERQKALRCHYLNLAEFRTVCEDSKVAIG